jgi:hypothetical protein
MTYQKIILSGERPKSWNVLKRLHWAKWQNEVDRCKWLILEAIRPSAPINEPVDITVTVYYAGRPHDASNVPAKLYEDGLVAAGILHDDAPRYVRSMTTKPRIDKNHPRVEIEIFGEVT